MPSDNFPPTGAVPLLGAILEYALLDPDEPSLLPDGSDRKRLEEALVLWSMSGKQPDLHDDRDLLNAARYNIWEQLLSGRLQAWGRDGPWGPWVEIPDDAWFSMREIDWLGCSVKHQLSGKVLCSIRVAPADFAPSMTGSTERAKLPLRRQQKGRKESYPWKDFDQELFRVLDEQGLPLLGDDSWSCQADVERYMRSWCERVWGKSPAESTIRDHIGKGIEHFKRKFSP